MLINFTNHPYVNWSEDQKTEAFCSYGQIIDFPFPLVDPNSNEEEINQMAKLFATKLIDLNPDAVLCQGEMGLCFAVVKILLAKKISVLHACSERITSESLVNGRIVKTNTFIFRRFRNYN